MTQKQAIAAATAAARQRATEQKVLLVSGDTLYLTPTPSGRITRRVTHGWDRDGNYYLSSRVKSTIDQICFRMARGPGRRCGGKIASRFSGKTLE